MTCDYLYLEDGGIKLRYNPKHVVANGATATDFLVGTGVSLTLERLDATSKVFTILRFYVHGSGRADTHVVAE